MAERQTIVKAWSKCGEYQIIQKTVSVYRFPRFPKKERECNYIITVILSLVCKLLNRHFSSAIQTVLHSN